MTLCESQYAFVNNQKQNSNIEVGGRKCGVIDGMG